MKSVFGAAHLLISLMLMVIITIPGTMVGAIKLEEARTLADSGNYEKAVLLFSYAARHLPWYCPVQGETGYAYYLSGQAEEAVPFFSRGEACLGLSLDQWLGYGDALMTIGEPGQAVLAWKLAMIQHGASNEAFSRLARAARQAGDFNHAIDYYRRSIDLSNDDVESLYQLALLLTAIDPASALAILMQVNNLDPDREAKIQEIRKELNLAFLQADSAYQYTVAGRLLGSLGEWDLAAEAFRQALSINNQYAQAWAWLAEAKQSTGRDGRSAMEKALTLDPENAGIHGLDGLLWMQMGKPENALPSYEKAAMLEPDNAIWLISLGEANSSAGNLSKALQYYYRAVELAPENPATWRALALFSVNNDIDVANTGMVASQQLSRLAPMDWMTFLITGRVAMMLNDQMSARDNFLDAIETAPEEPAPHFYLGVAYLEAQRYPLAYDKLVDVTNLDPTGPYGWQAKRLLEEYFP